MGMQRIIALGNARLSSQRCPGKMLRPFAGTTLTHVALDRLNRLRGFDGVYFAAHEPELQGLVESFPSVTLIRRSARSATVCNPISAVHDYLVDLDCDVVFWINSCHAMLRPETIEQALACFRGDHRIRSMTAVIPTHNWFYTLDGQAVNNRDPRCVDTKRTPPLLEVCHAFHGFSRRHLLETDSYWNNTTGDPHLFEIDPGEAVDVDTELDLLVAERVYAARVACVSA